MTHMVTSSLHRTLPDTSRTPIGHSGQLPDSFSGQHRTVHRTAYPGVTTGQQPDIPGHSPDMPDNRTPRAQRTSSQHARSPDSRDTTHGARAPTNVLR